MDSAFPSHSWDMRMLRRSPDDSNFCDAEIVFKMMQLPTTRAIYLLEILVVIEVFVADIAPRVIFCEVLAEEILSGELVPVYLTVPF